MMNQKHIQTGLMNFICCHAWERRTKVRNVHINKAPEDSNVECYETDNNFTR